MFEYMILGFIVDNFIDIFFFYRVLEENEYLFKFDLQFGAIVKFKKKIKKKIPGSKI